MKIFQKSPIYYILLLFNLIKFSLEEHCPRDKPILKSNECLSIYCTPEQFSSKECIISNKFSQIQWLNNFHIFNEKNMYHISVTENQKGDLFLSSQKVSDDYDKYLFAFDSTGEGLFYNKETDKYNCFEIIDFAVREYADYNNYIEIDGKGYLIGVPTDDDIYLIDYINNTIKQFSIKPISKSSETIFQMNDEENLFFTAYVFCKDTFNKDCYLHFQSFKLNTTKLEKVHNITNIPTSIGTRIYCNQDENDYIFCFYTKKVGENVTYEYDEEYDIEIPIYTPILDHFISVIEPDSFRFVDTLLLEHNYNLTRMFDETMHLKDNLYISAFSVDEDVIKIVFKNISYNEKEIQYKDYFSNINEIYINKDKKFLINHGSFKRNDLYKIDDNKFAIFIKEYSKDIYKATNSILLIYIFTIFNNDQNINVRRYLIDFELYNKKIYDDIRGYSLGMFFGVVLGLTRTKDDSQSIATFMTFGYVNATEQENIDTQLKYNNTNSKILLSKYINEIENNLFGYKYLGVIIISLPLEEDSGFFINNITNKEVEENEIIPRESELKFILSDSYESGIYSLQFAGIVEEPSYEEMNELAEEIFTYPENGNNVDEKDFYKPIRLIGKKINYKFRLSECYDSCSTCTSFSEDDNDHKCITCRNGFYFKENTNNCYDKIDTKYYFDKNDEKFKPCYKNCLTCSTKENSQNQMNCLSCENEFKFYNKSNNCLNCPNYVNFEQNECIDEIPEGYYLEDKELGSLGKCNYLCKTCIAGPYQDKYNHYHMNCKTCLYTDSSFKPIFDGDCPDSPEIIDPDSPVGGQCPINKPILKNGKCGLIYCTNQEFQNKICVIYNPIIKTQWLNNFHIFSESSTSLASIANDIINNQKVILFSQNVNKENGYIEKYMFGFNNNGTGIFYDKNKNIFESFKKMDFPEKAKLVEKIGYIEMDYEGYLLTTPIDNGLYLIDYIDNKITKKEINIPAYSTDKIILMEREDESISPDYSISYIYCKGSPNINDCYLMMKNFEAEEEQLTEKLSMNENIRIDYNSQINCYKDEQNYIRCTYTTIVDDSNYKHVIGFFGSGSFKLVKELVLENKYDNEPTLDSMVRLRNHVSIIAYSQANYKNIIKIIIKKIYRNFTIDNFEMSDYIPKIPEILLNEDNLYKFEGAKASSNSLVKISNEKFAILMNNFKNSGNNLNSEIVIFIFTIYDTNSKINIRHYPINFGLYNTFIDGKIIGYNLNDFFGALIELTSPGNKDLKRASFFTFGYINSTNDINPMEGNEILIVKKEKLKIKNYINGIENNLFGYELSGIKVISIPDEKYSGYFTINRNTKINKDDIITYTAELEFVMNENAKTGNYSISFAPILKTTAYYDKMNSYCQKLESYPKNEADTEKYFYNSKTLLGKYFTFNFYIKNGFDCYQNCETCYKESKDVNDQQCKECKNEYYKINGTDNCFYSMTTGYYFDKNKKLFMPCYKDCLSCSKSGDDIIMNCNSCDDDKFDYYKKSTNCLNCPKYVDFFQMRCINNIPDGYFLDDPVLGTIEKCHQLCQTCEKASTTENGKIHMNCKTCKYTNSKYKTEIEGNCPDTQEEKKENRLSEPEGVSTVLICISVISIIIILIIAAIIIYKKCYNKKNNKDDQDDQDYFDMKGKNISLEDEPINY